MKRCFLLGLLLAVTGIQAQPADTIFHNAKIITVDAAFRVTSGLTVKDGRVLAVDDLARLRLSGPQTKTFCRMAILS